MTTLSDSERARLETGLTEVCRHADLDPTGFELMKYTINAVYRIDAEGVVVRMTSHDRASVVSQVARVADAFAELGIPTVRLTGAKEVHVDNWSATIWELLPQPTNRRPRPVDLARPLKAIHTLDSLPFEIPRWDPIGRARSRVEQVARLGGPDHDFLRQWAEGLVGTPMPTVIDRLMERCAELSATAAVAGRTLPESIIHGDAHDGNLLIDTSGQVVICDLDRITTGPPEWDLTPTAYGVPRFGDDATQQQALADTYGLDVTTSPAWETLSGIRELQLVTSVIAALPGRPAVAQELAHRLRTFLAGDSTTPWHRYQ